MQDSEDTSVLFFVSLSDLVMLLLIFFIYLYSISTIDAEKFAQTAEALSSNPKTTKDIVKEIVEKQKEVTKMSTEIQTYLKEQELENVVSVQLINQELVLNLGDSLLFDVGSAELKPKAQEVLRNIGKKFLTSKNDIIVEGYTDDVPINTFQFPSNWELSSARASSVVRYLMTMGIEGARFTAVGYDQYYPVKPNNSAENRAKNRRVKITLKPSRSERALEKDSKAIVNNK